MLLELWTRGILSSTLARSRNQRPTLLESAGLMLLGLQPVLHAFHEPREYGFEELTSLGLLFQFQQQVLTHLFNDAKKPTSRG
jgi:hypothetical protein